MLLNVIVFVYVLSLAHTYICIFAHIVTSILTYTQIFPQSLAGKERGKGRESEKREECVRREWGKELLPSK